MAKILPFWKSDQRTAAPSSLSEAGLVSGQMIDTASRESLRGGDWSNQELADLYRVKQLLERAGVPVSIDRGLTDEGDPWFVFCDAHDEVFVHLCRLNGVFLLDSPNIDSPLRGDDFSQLIDSFVRRAAPPQINSNVVQLRPREGLYLHPAVMLTALIWSLYIASDELVGVAHAEEGGGHLPLLGLEGAGGFAGEITLEQAAQTLYNASQDASLDDKGLVFRGPNDRTGSEATGTGSIGTGSSTTSYTMAASISAIALSFGFFSPEIATYVQEALLFGERRQDDKAASSEAAHNRLADADVLAGEGHAGAVQHERPLEDQATASAEDVPQMVLTQGEPDGRSFSKHVIAVDSAVLDDRDVGFPTAAGFETSAVVTVAVAEESPSSNERNLTDLARFLASDLTVSGTATSYKIGGVTMVASFDVHNILGASIEKSFGGSYASVGDVIVGPQPASQSNPFPQFDDAVRDFVNYLLGKMQSVEFVALANEIIFIDLSAFDSSDDVSYAKSWVMTDGSLISTVGHLSDFVDFGLA